MATIYSLKPAFQGFLRPVVSRMAAAGISANLVTVAATLLSIAWGAVIATTGGASFALLGLPLVLLLRMALNAADGMLAREHGQASRLGLFLNETGDVVSDAALYLPLMLVLAPSVPWAVAVAMLATTLTEFVGVLGLSVGSTRRYDGPFGKSDRAVYFSVLSLAEAIFALPPWLPLAALAVAMALSAVTIVNRVRAGLCESGDG